MTHRTTFVLDADTTRRLKKLALRWQVSQAEVVRRAVAQQPNLLARLKTYHSAATLNTSVADTYIAQAHADRKRWRAK